MNQETAVGNPQTSRDAPPEKKKKRAVCSRCQRPAERACICAALPDSRISLQKCELVILQHPQELKRKNRSLPLVELCMGQDDIHTVVARRFGNQVDSHVMDLIQNEHRNVMLVYPSDDAKSLTEGLQQICERNTAETGGKTTIVFLDATWRFAKQMYKANESQFSKNVIKVALRQEDWSLFIKKSEFKPARFDIRTPPSPNHLSTAECIAWIISTIENDPSHYDTIMKPLDLMVEQWHSFSGRGTFSFTNGDGSIDEATQDDKRRKGRKRKKGSTQ
jgi:DTW domain-containing protein YfiP